MGYFIRELSETIGFEGTAIDAIEQDQREIIVALAAIKHLSLIFGIPLQVLLEKI
jgi:hypothetical protein